MPRTEWPHGCAHVDTKPACPKCGGRMHPLMYMGTEAGLSLFADGLWVICLRCLIVRPRTH
jgi:hypothetical protein